MGAIDRSAQSLSRLVDDLLTVSRIDAGALDVYPKVIETNQTVEEMVKDFENASDIKLCTPDEQLEVYADPDHFREAASATEAIEMVMQMQPELIVLDHLLDGHYTGLEVAPVLKAAAPGVKVILFTGFDHLRAQAETEAVDAFLVKTNLGELLPLAQRLLGLDSPPPPQGPADSRSSNSHF